MEMRASLFISSCFAVLFGLAQELDSTSVSAPASDDSTMILLDNVVQASNDSILVKKKFLSNSKKSFYQYKGFGFKTALVLILSLSLAHIAFSQRFKILEVFWQFV